MRYMILGFWAVTVVVPAWSLYANITRRYIDVRVAGYLTFVVMVLPALILWAMAALLEAAPQRRVAERLRARPGVAFVAGSLVAVITMGSAAVLLVCCPWCPDAITFSFCTMLAAWLVWFFVVPFPRPGRCLHCGYDVLHNTERVRCTECGTPFASFALSGKTHCGPDASMQSAPVCRR